MKSLKIYIKNLLAIFTTKKYYGWGRKKSGRFASWCQKVFGGKAILYEDGFIRSLGLGVEGSPSFSIVEDDVGIYYDATVPSKLENILNNYDFKNDQKLIKKASDAIKYMLDNNISKFNNAPLVDEVFCKKYRLNEKKNILIISQTDGDSSLKYGMLDNFTTDDMIFAAISENPNANIYLKVHPDVLSGRKSSDIDLEQAREQCIIIDENVNTISLLKYFDKVYTKTSGMGFEALLCGCECVCFGMPFYAGWGVTTDKTKIKRRKVKRSVEEIFASAYILYTKYYNPYTKENSDIFDTMRTIVMKREKELSLGLSNKKSLKKAYLFGFSKWKQGFVKKFLYEYLSENIYFIDTNSSMQIKLVKLALKKGLDKNSDIYFWGSKSFDDVENYAKQNSMKIYRIEDGFIRSIGLGSDLTQPYSLIIDKSGIYFDPTNESDLENYINYYDFKSNNWLLERAKMIQKEIIKNKISKYNTEKSKVIDLPQDRITALVIGQVEDDASIEFGADGMSNLELLRSVKAKYSDRYIIYKPHPDVISGNRVGNISTQEALKYCDKIVSDVSINDVLELVDEVHTMTSLTGFEGLIYGKKVYTYGMPFYAGWGLTTDIRYCKRRKRKVSLEELIAAAYVLYPRYISIKTKDFCEVECLIKELKEQKNSINLFYKIKSKVYKFSNILLNKMYWFKDSFSN